LQEYLPEISGFTQEKPRGETAQYGTWSYSTASARYTSGESNIEVEIHDYAKISALYAPFQMWLSGNFMREDEEGYEKAVKIDGFPGMEEYKHEAKRGKLTLMVGDRFIVVVEGNGVTMDALKDALKKIDLAKLTKETAV
jgi:hypothetical protein